MKLLIVNNLSSGFKEGSIYDFIRSVSEDGCEIVLRCTDGTTRIENLLADAQDFDAVVASGGDGTVAAVCTCLANTGIPVLPFPSGTSNLLALNLALPFESHALAKVVEDGKTLDFDWGCLRVHSDTSSDIQSVGFGIIAGAGYDATIMKEAEKSKGLLGSMAYWSAAITNPTPKFAHFTLTLDDETRVECDGLGVLLVNFAKIQFDISLTHENNPRDGKFDVMILKAQNAFGLIPAFFAGILDRGGDFPERTDAIEIYQASKVVLESDPLMEIQYDGEPMHCFTPLTAEIVPSSVRLYVSQEGLDLFA